MLGGIGQQTMQHALGMQGLASLGAQQQMAAHQKALEALYQLSAPSIGEYYGENRAERTNKMKRTFSSYRDELKHETWEWLSDALDM